jgi:hypothetical protein
MEAAQLPLHQQRMYMSNALPRNVDFVHFEKVNAQHRELHPRGKGNQTHF